jgi:hypothetical protein
VSMHGINTSRYRGMFPDAQTRSKEFFDSRSKGSKAMWDNRTPEERKWITDNWRAGWTDESVNKLIKSRKAYFANMSDQDRKEMIDQIARATDLFYNSPDYEANRIARSRKISASLNHKLKTDPSFYEERRQAMIAAGKIQAEWLRTCSKEELAEYLEPRTTHFEYKGKQYGVRSSYEEKMVKILVDLGLRFVQEQYLKKPNGRWYRADFLVEERLVIETKSKFWYGVQGGDRTDFLRKEAARLAGLDYLLVMNDLIVSQELPLIIGNKISSMSAGQSEAKKASVDDIV